MVPLPYTERIHDYRLATAYGILPSEIDDKLTMYDMSCYLTVTAIESAVDEIHKRNAKKKRNNK